MEADHTYKITHCVRGCMVGYGRYRRTLGRIKLIPLCILSSFHSSMKLNSMAVAQVVEQRT